MAVNRRNLEMYRGDTYVFDVTVLNAGNPINITDYQFRMTAKYTITDTDVDAVFTISSPGNIELTDPSNGEVTVTISPANTSSLERGQTYRLYYDLQMYSAPGTVYTICNGILKINPDVSVSVP
jgi:hypothetical protein